MLGKELKIMRRLQNEDEIFSLYRRSFPKTEQFPYWLLRLMTIREGFHFTAYYDGDVFCGLTYTVVEENCVFLLYLSVDDRVRSQGYGAKILRHLQKKYEDRQLYITIESVEQSADNYSQRKKRLAFYQKSGLRSTGWYVKMGKEEYWLLTEGTHFHKKDFQHVIEKVFFGLYHPALYKK